MAAPAEAAIRELDGVNKGRRGGGCDASVGDASTADAAVGAPVGAIAATAALRSVFTASKNARNWVVS